MILALAMLLGTARAEEPAPPAPAETSSSPQPTAATLSLGDEEREGLREALGAVSELRGEQRRDALLQLLDDESLSPAQKAAVSRALGAAWDDEAPFSSVMAAAMRDKRSKGDKERAPSVVQLTPEKLTNVREYQRRRIMIRQETEIRGGGTSVVSSPWANPYSVTPSQVVQDPIYTVQGWGIYQGSRRLSVPEYLGVIDSAQMQQYLEDDILRLNRTSKALYAFGGLGVAATVVGVIGMNAARQQNDSDLWLIFFATAGGGVATMLTGFVGGSIPASKATRVEQDPEYTFTPEQVREGIDGYNDELRQELELSPEEVLLIEAAGSGANVQPYVVPTATPGGLGLSLGVGGSF
ncbi:MAG TPA: hypothetical protein QGF58_09585 [Myxococcota bacterium]|nr:hypothetical protein [Myxococcota bacterium]